jgi:hypothetical protein
MTGCLKHSTLDVRHRTPKAAALFNPLELHVEHSAWKVECWKLNLNVSRRKDQWRNS